MAWHREASRRHFVSGSFQGCKDFVALSLKVCLV